MLGSESPEAFLIVPLTTGWNWWTLGKSESLQDGKLLVTHPVETSFLFLPLH